MSDETRTAITDNGDGAVIQPRLTVVPLTLRQAAAFVGDEHRHHEPPAAHKFSIGVEDQDGNLRGVAIAGRPKARAFDPYRTLEVVRLATDGCPNACSALYGAVARIGSEMGYERHNVITYTLVSEPGTSLHAAGWWQDHTTKEGDSWDRPGRPRTDKHPLEAKRRWRAAKPPADDQEAVA